MCFKYTSKIIDDVVSEDTFVNTAVVTMSHAFISSIRREKKKEDGIFLLP